MRCRVSAAVLCAVIGAVVFGASPASACSPAPPREGPPPGKYELIRESIGYSKLAITGRVTKVRLLETPHPDNTSYEATIRISRIYKGMSGPTVLVRGDTGGSLCGFGMLTVGQRLGLLLTQRVQGRWEILNGSRIPYVDLERVMHGRSYRPHTGD